MRIAFVSDNVFPWFNGGIEKRRFIIMHELAESGHEVHCFTIHRQSMPGTEFRYKGIRYHCVGEAEGWQGMYTNSGKRRSITWPFMFSVRIFFKILAYRFDILDADTFPFLHLPPLFIYSRIRGTRFAITWHEVWTQELWKRYMGAPGRIGYFVEWLCARLADMQIANTSTTKELLVHELGVKAGRIVVLPVAVDREEIERFTARHRYGKKDKFIVVNRLVKHKRVQLAIEAVARTKAKLVVVGTGPELESLESFARERAPGRVTFEHSISTEQLFREMCESKALIMPSEREGLSLVTLEALALGTPVVIADTSSLPKEVRVMCLEAKEERMGALLERIIRNYASYGERSARMKGRVIDEFSGDAAERVYKKIGRD